jgi:hypothetical protein
MTIAPILSVLDYLDFQSLERDSIPLVYVALKVYQANPENDPLENCWESHYWESFSGSDKARSELLGESFEGGILGK